jgi:DNA invertase Pin-like site-specific DNA recombinase
MNENINLTVACYCRVSKDDMHNENQTKIIQDYLIRNSFNMEKVKWFKEEMSTRKTRPIKAQLINYARNGMFDIVIVVRIDRFARSLVELTMDVEDLINRGVRFISIQNGFDFSKKSYNATQQLIFGIFCNFAQFEREIIRERTNEGLARAKAQGKKLGRPFKIKQTPPRNPEDFIGDSEFIKQTDVCFSESTTNAEEIKHN